MKRSIVCLLALVLSLSAQEDPASLDQALQDMLSERSSEAALTQTIDKARSLGASDQAILEARFLFLVDRREDQKLVELLPDLEAKAKKFRIEESEIFAVKEDWLAVVEYVRALKALHANDTAGFKKHITEAFWLSPGQGAAFAPHIERLRLAEAMKNVRFDFSRSFTHLAGGQTAINELAKDKKALFLHFFSPWSRECEESMKDFTAVAKSLEDQGFAVVSVITEGMPEAVDDTLAILESQAQPPGSWIVDSSENSLSRQLRINSAPTMVLVDLDGRIRFNGHPSEDALWEDIQTIAPGFKRPAKSTSGH